MGETPLRFRRGMSFSNADLEDQSLPEGLVPISTDDDNLPIGLTPITDHYEGEGTNPAANYLRADRQPKKTPYTGSPHRLAPQNEPEKSLGENIWTELNRPHLDLTPSEETLNKIDPRSLNESPTMARIRGFGAGALKGLGDLASGFTSDLGLLTLPAMLEGGAAGESIANAAKALSPAAKAAGAAFAASGAKTALDPRSTLEQRLSAIPQIAGGIAPFLHTPVTTHAEAASPLEQLGEAAASNEPQTPPEPRQSNFFNTTPEGNIDTSQPPVRPNRPPASALEKEFNKPIQWVNAEGKPAQGATIANPAAEFFQGDMFNPSTPFTSSAKQLPLTEQVPPEPTNQGNLPLEPSRPTFSDKYTEASLFPQGQGGGLNEDMPQPRVGDENTPVSNAKQFVEGLPDTEDNKSSMTKESPFPKVDDKVLDEIIRNKQVDYTNPRVEDVPLHNLKGTQDSVNPDIVNQYIDEGDRAPMTEVPTDAKGKLSENAPTVIRIGDENVLAGGHHRATADLANGKDTMQAVVYDAKVPPELLDRFKASLERDRSRVIDSPDLYPQEMRATKNPENIAIGGGDPRLLKMLGQNLYSKDRPTIAVKELLQNAIDEHAIAGTNEPIRVVFNRSDRNIQNGNRAKSITVQDRGRGMTPDQLRTVFTNVGESGKTEEQIARGGFGIAKAAPLMGGDYSRYESVVNENGKKVMYSFEGDPKQLQKQEVGVPIKRTEMPDDTPTGFKAKVYYPENTYLYTANDMANSMARHSFNVSSPIHILEKSGELDKEEAKFLRGDTNNYHQRQGEVTEHEPNPNPPELQDTLHLPGADVNFHYNTPTSEDKAQHYNLNILNKGLFQVSDRHNEYSPFGALRNVPSDISADVHPTVEEDAPNYPFTMNREQLDSKVMKAIHEWVEQNVVSGALKRQKQMLQDMYSQMAPIPQRGGTFRPTVLFDPDNHLTASEKAELTQSPLTKRLATIIDGYIHRSVEATGQEDWADKLQKTGISLDPTHHGIHIPNPDEANKSTILINPFNFLRDENVPKDAAREIASTMLHEAGHIGSYAVKGEVNWGNIDPSDPDIADFFKKYFGEVQHSNAVRDAGHALDWLRNTAEVYAKSGNRAFSQAVGEINNAISDPSTGGYTPEVSKLLQIYSDRQRRAGTAQNILSGTGVKSEATGTPPNAFQSNAGSRTPQSATGRSLTEAFNRPISGPESANAASESAKSQAHPAESQTAETIRNVQTSIPQSQIPNRIANISDHLEQAKNDPATPKDEKEGLIEKALNFQRTLLTSYDLSAPGRQGLPLIWNKAWWTSWKPMLQSFGSEGAYNNIMKSIENDPSGLFKKNVRILKNGEPSKAPAKSFANEAGLDLTDTLSHKEELFRSKWAEDLVPGVKPSVRAYTAYMNKLRADTFKSMVKAANAETDLVSARKIADFINVATGRGNLGEFEGASKALAQVFFSPRLTASRLQMYGRTLNPMYYSSVPPVVRQAQLKSAFATAGVGMLMGQLAKNVGAEVNSDPTNTDFGKIKFGTTRIDPFAGHQQYLVAAARMLTGKSTSSTTGRTNDLTSGKFGMPTRADVFSRFVEQKLAPVPSLIWSWMQGKDFDGTPFDLKKEIVNRTAPLAAQDIYQVWQQNPDVIPGWLATGSSIGGFGVQTYGR